EECHHFFITLITSADIYIMFSQQIVTFAHKIDEHMQKVNTIKHDGVILYIAVQRFLKINRMFCPVHGLLFVMADVVAIVPALMVVFGIDAGNTVPVIITGIRSIYKRMLCPVAHHGYQPEQEERYDEYPKRSHPVNEGHTYTKQDEHDLAPGRTV